MTGCFFAHRGPCDGPMDRAHIIPKGRIKREYPHGAWVTAGGLVVPLLRADERDRANPRVRVQREVVWDKRVVVSACRRHHADWDNRAFNIARGEVPEACEDYAREYGLVWSLDADYGERGTG